MIALFKTVLTTIGIAITMMCVFLLIPIITTFLSIVGIIALVLIISYAIASSMFDR